MSSFNEIEILIGKDKNNKISIEDFKTFFPDEIEKLEEVLLNYIGENDPKILTEEISDKWQYQTKKHACLYDYFKSLDVYKTLLKN